MTTFLIVVHVVVAAVLIVDATNLKRNLFLASQVMELGLPIAIALNMTDLAERDGIKIDADKLTLEQAPVQVEGIVSNAMSMVAEHAQRKKIGLVKAVAPLEARHAEIVEPDDQQEHDQRALRRHVKAERPAEEDHRIELVREPSGQEAHRGPDEQQPHGQPQGRLPVSLGGGARFRAVVVVPAHKPLSPALGRTATARV